MTAPSPQQYVQGQGTVSADNLNTFQQTCTNNAQARDLIGTLGMLIYIEGTVSIADGGQGQFYWNPTSLGPDDNQDTIVPFGAAVGAWVRLIPSGNFSNVNALRSSSGSNGPIVATTGYYTPGDGGGAFYAFVPTDTTSADNGGSIIVNASGSRYYLQYNQPLTPLQFGAHGDGVTDDSSFLTNMFTYINDLSYVVNDISFPVNGAGRVYATSLPLNVPKYLYLSGCTFKALAGGSWSGNTGNVLYGYGTNGILTLASCYGVQLLDIYLDANRIPNVQCLYITVAGNIEFINVNGRHWVSGGNGLVMDAGGTANMFDPDFMQWVTSDAEYNVAADRYGCGLLVHDSYDSTIVGGNFAQALTPIYIDPASNHVRFIGVHFYNAFNGGTPYTNPVGAVVAGYAIEFLGCYVDSCYFSIPVTSSTNSSRPQVTISNSTGLYNALAATFSAWIQCNTSVANTNLFSMLTDSNTFGNVNQFSFTTSGAGSFALSAASISTLNAITGGADFRGPGGSSVLFSTTINLLGVGSLKGWLESCNTTSSTSYTISTDDTGGQINLIGVSPQVNLSNTITTNVVFWVVSVNSAGTLVPSAGATINGSSSNFTLTQNTPYRVVMAINTGGSSAQWFAGS